MDNHLNLYQDEETKLFLEALDRIRNILILLFFVVIVVLNYIFLPTVLIYPWILLVWLLYTAYKLIYPFSVFGYFGKKAEHAAKEKLMKKVDTFEKYKAEFNPVKEFGYKDIL